MVIHPDGNFEYKEDFYGLGKKMMGEELKLHQKQILETHEGKPFA